MIIELPKPKYPVGTLLGIQSKGNWYIIDYGFIRSINIELSYSTLTGVAIHNYEYEVYSIGFKSGNNFPLTRQYYKDTYFADNTYKEDELDDEDCWTINYFDPKDLRFKSKLMILEKMKELGIKPIFGYKDTEGINLIKDTEFDNE